MHIRRDQVVISTVFVKLIQVRSVTITIACHHMVKLDFYSRLSRACLPIIPVCQFEQVFTVLGV